MFGVTLRTVEAERDPKNKERKKEKGRVRKQTCDVSRVCQDHPRCRIATWICMFRRSGGGVVIYSLKSPFRDFGATGVEICPFPLVWPSAFTAACILVRGVCV